MDDNVLSIMVDIEVDSSQTYYYMESLLDKFCQLYYALEVICNQEKHLHISLRKKPNTLIVKVRQYVVLLY